MTTRKPLLLALALALPAMAAGLEAQTQVPPAAPPATTPAAAAAVAAADAGPATRLTFPDALRRALDANPVVGSARAEIGAASATSQAAFSAVLPHLAFSGNGIRNSQEASFGSGDEARTILPANDWNYRLTFTQPIYAGNRERRALQQSRIGVERARQGALDAEDQVLFSTAADYHAVLAAAALVEVERQNLDLIMKRRRQAQALFEAGETTRVESLRAETDVKGAERQLAEAQQQRERAAGRLRLDLALEGPLDVAPVERASPPVPQESVLASEAEARRPEVRQAADDLEIARLEVAKQRGAYLPVVTSDGGYIQQRSAFPSDSYGYVALRLNVPLYQGGEVGARVALARERQKQAELRLGEVKQRVREEVHQALVALSTAETQLALAREELASSQAEYAQAENLYRAQETTALDFEVAERSLADARRVVTTSGLDRDIAELAVWAAAGMLQQTLLPEGTR